MGNWQVRPVFPLVQAQLFGNVHEPLDEQTAGLLASTPKHNGISQKEFPYPELQTQELFRTQTPLELQTREELAMILLHKGIWQLFPT